MWHSERDGWFRGPSVAAGHLFVLTNLDEWYEFSATGEVLANGDWYSGFGAGSMSIFTCQAR